MLPFLIVSALCWCEVFVLEPLDLFNSRGNLRIQSKFENWCDQLRDAGVKGIMLEVWWDYTEPSPKNYKWNGYETVFSIIRNKGLKIIPVFSFNQWQVSIGDSVYIGIPTFVWEGTTYPAFTDSHRNKDNEYISFAYDNIKIGPNNERTPLEMYRDWMTGFNMVNGNNGYEKVISMLKQHNVDVCFSCLEMNDDYNSAANPPALVREILEATKRNGLRFEGQNLLQRYDWDAFNQIKSWVNHGLSTFTYFRMDDALMNGRNWEYFKAFVNQMK